MYYVSLGCGTRNRLLDFVTRARKLEIIEDDVFGTGFLPPAKQAMVFVDADWEVNI